MQLYNSNLCLERHIKFIKAINNCTEISFDVSKETKVRVGDVISFSPPLKGTISRAIIDEIILNENTNTIKCIPSKSKIIYMDEKMSKNKKGE